MEDKTAILDARQLLKLADGRGRRSACFVVIAGGQAGRVYKLTGSEMQIGRTADAGIMVEDDGVSRLHARVVLDVAAEPVTVAIEDLGSTNGTFVNGERVQRRVLADGDKIQIGTTTILKFTLQDSVEEDFQNRQYQQATRDALTGCYNKRYFQERLPHEHTFASRHNKHLTVAMMDIDHFKQVNDTYGHPAGDAVLREVARLIGQAVRSDDVLARYGGEEFVLLIRETLPDAAFVTAERVRRTVEAARIFHDGKAISVTISIGLATWDAQRNPVDAEGLLEQADEYLYRAKQKGRNRTESAAIE